MTNTRVLKHEGAARTTIRLISDPAPVTIPALTGNPLERLSASCRRVEAAAIKNRQPIRKLPARSPHGGAVIKNDPVKPVAKTAPAPAAQPTVTTDGAHGLRSALGLSTRREDVDRTAKEATEHVRRAAALQVRTRTPAPAATKASVTTPTIPNGSLSGQPFAPLDHAAVWMALHQLYVQNNRNPVTVSVSELGKMTGLTADAVQAALNAMEATGQVARQPGRAGSLPRFSPVI